MDNTPLPLSVYAHHPAFEKKEFAKYMKSAGRAYRKQAMELITICRIFTDAHEQTLRGYDELRR